MLPCTWFSPHPMCTTLVGGLWGRTAWAWVGGLRGVLFGWVCCGLAWVCFSGWALCSGAAAWGRGSGWDCCGGAAGGRRRAAGAGQAWWAREAHTPPHGHPIPHAPPFLTSHTRPYAPPPSLCAATAVDRVVGFFKTPQQLDLSNLSAQATTQVRLASSTHAQGCSFLPSFFSFTGGTDARFE